MPLPARLLPGYLRAFIGSYRFGDPLLTHSACVLSPLLALGLLIAPLSSARGDCGQAVTTTDLVAMLEGAEWAYSQADLRGFSQASERIRTQIPCLSEALPRNTAARVHRAVGLRGFVDRDPDVSTRAFAAARVIEPAYTFPSAMVPAGNPVFADYNAVAVEAGEYVDVLAPADGYLVFDGRPDTSRPRFWPTLVQFVSAEGQVTDTFYLWPEQSLPVYDIAAAAPDPDPLPVASTGRDAERAVSVPLLAVAGGLAVASGALFLASRSTYDSYYDPSTPVPDLAALRSRHNGMVWASRGAAAGAALTGTGAFLVVRW